MISIATLCLIVASGSQILAPRFFGKVIDAAQHSMGKIFKSQSCTDPEGTGGLDPPPP